MVCDIIICLVDVVVQCRSGYLERGSCCLGLLQVGSALRQVDKLFDKRVFTAQLVMTAAD